MSKKITMHFIVLYVLVILILVLFAFSLRSNAQEEWLCVQETCTETAPVGDEWIAQNCGEFQPEPGEVFIACQLTIDGVEQIVALSSLNLSAIRTCVQTQCLQEVRVRTVLLQ